MVGWHHQLDGPEFEQSPGDSEGQGSLVYCSPRSHKEQDVTKQLNNKGTDLIMFQKHKDQYIWSSIMELVYRMELGQGWARLDHVGPLGQGRQLG